MIDPLPERYSDEQLYALARYLYGLKPSKNPNRENATTGRGQKIFARAGCGSCHTPPFYTSNKLSPAAGFTVPPEHLRRYDTINRSVGTDPELALHTRKGTGYYKVPSLKGVWYRGPFPALRYAPSTTGSTTLGCRRLPDTRSVSTCPSTIVGP